MANANIYVELTTEFNAGGLRSVLSSGQAVVLHKLAIMSKDGDWILRDNKEALGHVLNVLERRGARYRFGAPLDSRWMAGGWSAHFEFRHDGLRVRTDFVTRPPRLGPEDLDVMWREQVGMEIPFVSAVHLAKLKKTNREKDYVVIGELARLLSDPAEQLLHSRSARDLVEIAAANPELVRRLTPRRPLLAKIPDGTENLEAALDAERRRLIHDNEQRLQRYMDAAETWAETWPAVAKKARGLPLLHAHQIVLEHAEGVLPFHLPGDQP